MKRVQAARESALAGKRVVFTRPRGQGEELAALLAAHGAELVEYPVIAIRPIDEEELLEARARVAALGEGRYDGLLLTSQTAVEILAPLLTATQTDLGRCGVRVFAVGKKTAAALSRLGAEPSTPEESTSEGLLAAVRATCADLRGRTFLFPRARSGRLAVIRGLREAGAEVDSLCLYDTVPRQEAPALPMEIDWVTFMSPSAVEAFLHLTPMPPGARICCIGPTTATAVTAAGLTVDRVSHTQSIEAMIAAMAED